MEHALRRVFIDALGVALNRRQDFLNTVNARESYTDDVKDGTTLK